MQGLGASVLINARGVYPKFYSNLREQYITRKLTKAANAVHGTEFTTWAENSQRFLIFVRNKYECTMDQELEIELLAGCICSGHCVCTHQMAALFYVK